MTKAQRIEEAQRFEDIPNVGPRVARSLKVLGFTHPRELVGCDGFELYERLCTKTKTRHDPCLLDTFLSVADFAAGAPARPWWHYTRERKRRYPDI